MFLRAYEEMHPLHFCVISSITCFGRSGTSHDKIHFLVDGSVVEYDVEGESD